MRNPVILAHKTIIRRQWVEALLTQAAGYGMATVAIAAVLATAVYAASTALNPTQRT
ncbi:MAG: hypothetical protein HC857_13255, partial [Synechococcales cyanobacterium RU_4_20]|nr:hypothetical protein [Synechococcales cyanobacterium RU_4_20]